MKIIVYTTDDPEAPADARAMAKIRCLSVGRGGKRVMGWAPVHHMAATPEVARAEIEAWWNSELAKWKKLTPKQGKPRALAEAAAGEAYLPAFDEEAAAAEDWEEEAV